MTSKQKRILGVVLGMAVVLIAGVCFYQRNKTFHKYKVKEETKIDAGYNYHYLPFGDALLKYSADGAAYFNADGEIWNESYEIQSPIADACGDYAVIADQNSNKVYVFNKEKLQGTMETDYPIVKVQVSRQGVVAAILEDDTASYIQMMNKEGEVLVERKTVLSKTGYPMDFSMSEDATKMIVSYVYIEGTEVKSKVVFYHFGDVGKEQEDNIVGGFNQYRETLVPDVEFVNEDTAIAIGDNMFTIYSIVDKPSVIYEDKIEKEIQKVFYSKNYFGMIFDSGDEKKPYQAVVYDLTGKKVMDTTYSGNYKEVKLDGKNLLLYGDTECKVITFDGKVRFDYKMKKTINGMYVTDQTYRYILLTDNKIQTIELR